MVRKSFNTSSSIKPSHRLFRFFIIAGLLTFSILVLINYVIHNFSHSNDSNNGNIAQTDEISSSVLSEQSAEDSVGELKIIDAQPIIENFVNSTGGNKGILVYDVEQDKIIGSHNVNEKFNTASLYKLFVVYEGYRRIENGEWNSSDQAGATGHTILECLDLAIRESDSSCAETLWNEIGHNELDNILASDYDIHNTDISNLISNPEDILAVMKLFYNHPDVKSEELINQMKDSFLNQPKTTYDWRQGLPGGFSQANVYNKVGWDYNADTRNWNIYHDAAIIEFPEDNRHFIIVVMTNHIPYEKISEFGANFEQTYLSNKQTN